jgi:hypothetical protein
MVDQKTQPSPSEGEATTVRLDRLLAHLRSVEARLRSLNRESMASLGESMAVAADELRALHGALRSDRSREPLRARIMELVRLSRRVLALFDSARRFHATLLRIHQTEQHGYGGLVDIPGARNLATFPHRLEMRG